MGIKHRLHACCTVAFAHLWLSMSRVTASRDKVYMRRLWHKSSIKTYAEGMIFISWITCVLTRGGLRGGSAVGYAYNYVGENTLMVLTKYMCLGFSLSTLSYTERKGRGKKPYI